MKDGGAWGSGWQEMVGLMHFSALLTDRMFRQAWRYSGDVLGYVRMGFQAASSLLIQTQISRLFQKDIKKLMFVCTWRNVYVCVLQMRTSKNPGV